jgi:hypothetical protein
MAKKPEDVHRKLEKSIQELHGHGDGDDKLIDFNCGYPGPTSSSALQTPHAAFSFIQTPGPLSF